jgi:hypothetical protein
MNEPLEQIILPKITVIRSHFCHFINLESFSGVKNAKRTLQAYEISFLEFLKVKTLHHFSFRFVFLQL